MPELPEVLNYEKYLRQTSMHSPIQSIDINDKKVVQKDFEKYKNKLKNQSVEETYRRGKYLFCKLSSGNHLAFHFGMTGNFSYSKNNEPDYSQVKFHFDDDYTLHYICKRKLGKVDYTEDLDKYLEYKKLGPDAFEITQEDFTEFLNKKRGSIKSALMDQKSIAGIGNICSDEICFQAGIHPGKKVKNIQDPGKLYNTMQRTLKTVADHYPDYDLPKAYLLPHREEGEDCPRCSGTIINETINGRSSYFCNSCQS